jgi:hypothetical protein
MTMSPNVWADLDHECAENLTSALKKQVDLFHLDIIDFALANILESPLRRPNPVRTHQCNQKHVALSA